MNTRKSMWVMLLWWSSYSPSISLIWSLMIAAFSNSQFAMATCISFPSSAKIIDFSALVSFFNFFLVPLCSPVKSCTSSSPVFTLSILLILEIAMLGFILCFWLCFICVFLLRYVSKSALVMLSVMLSP